MPGIDAINALFLIISIYGKQVLDFIGFLGGVNETDERRYITFID